VVARAPSGEVMDALAVYRCCTCDDAVNMVMLGGADAVRGVELCWCVCWCRVVVALMISTRVPVVCQISARSPHDPVENWQIWRGGRHRSPNRRESRT
jgi:hypothetical protein